MRTEKQRFFKKPPSLFVEDHVVDIEKELFASELVGALGHLDPDTINRLYQKHGDAAKAIQEMKPKPQEPRQETKKRKVRSARTPSVQAPSNQAPSSQAPSSSAESDEVTSLMIAASNHMKAELEARRWRRFIGSIPVQAWTTKPCMKPFQYDEKLTMKRLIPSNTSIAQTNIIRLFNSSGREIARIPEDLTRIFSPLIDLSMAEFEVTVLESTRRLSTGESFLVQIDIYISNTAFTPVTTEDDYTMKKFKKSNKSTFSFAETNNEAILRLRQFALAKLFERLDLRPTKSFVDDTEDDGIETIDVDDTPEDSLKPADNIDLDQLRQFYQANNQSHILSSLPEDTVPPPTNFKLDLRGYQKHGLSWMLTREKEMSVLRDLNGGISSQVVREIEEHNCTVNPLWKRYKWPNTKNDYFYANTFNGELSLERPVTKNTLLGGVIADEMGLGKTISALALVNSVPYDTDPTPGKLPYASKSTLIVVPMSLLTQWKKEFDKCNNNPRHYCHVYYGDATDTSLPELIKREDIPVVVLTTYGTVVNEFTRLSKQRDERGVLPAMGIYGVEFFRIVIDEGHNIRNRTTKSARSIYELNSRRKWVLTGTPIVNRLDDLYSLIKFLRLEPWCNFSYWKTFVTTPFEQKKIPQTLEIIKSILDPIFLRRTKNMKQKDGTPIVELPPKEVVIEEVEFNEREQRLYDWFKSKAAQTVNEGIKSGQLLKQYTQILTHILRLRQICCHADLVGCQVDEEVQAALDGEEKEELAKLQHTIDNFGFLDETDLKKAMYPLYEKVDLAESECSICTTAPIGIGEAVVTTCGHTFCFPCLLEHLEFQTLKKQALLCPNCRSPISKYRLFKIRRHSTSKKEVRFHTQAEVDDPSSSYPFQLYWYDPNKTSSKLEALVKHLRTLKQTNPGEKAILFSQFSAYLDIIENELKMSDDFCVYKFDGRLHLADRQKVLDKFAEKSPPDKITVLLLSLKAGGVGLNLTTASRAYMMDPWWSPSVEDQAIDRIHRIGQNETVKVVRFIVKGSIEIKMLKIQERKKQIGEAVGAQEDERRQRRLEEIEMLFEE